MAQNTDKRRIKIERPMTPEEQAAADKAAEVRKSADRIARQIIDMTRNGLFVTLRFMDVALCQFSYINSDQLAENLDRVRTIATTGQHMIYDPQYVIEQYMKDKQSLSRDYLHMVLHCVFRHPFVSNSLDRAAWDLACDIAVENIICDLDVKQANTRDSQDIQKEIERIREMMSGQMTAERLYAWLRGGGAQRKDMEKWRHLFRRDDHAVWWEIAKQIEEEMKRRAEEEKDERAEDDEKRSDTESEDDGENDADEDKENDDEAGADEDGEGEEDDEDGSDDSDSDASGDGSDEEGQENDETDPEASEEDDGEEEEEGSEESKEDTEKESEEAEEDSEEDEEWREDEYEEEYSSTPGQTMDREDPDDMADPDSDTHDTGEESDDGGSGGGGAGDDPEQSEDEGSGAGESPEGMSGEVDQDQDGKQDDDRKPDSNMSGTAGEGKQDDSPGDDPFSDDENSGSSQNMSGNGGKQQPGTSGGEHSAGTGGGGDGSQSAWEHSSGEATQRGSGEDGERSQMNGSSGNKEQLQPGSEQQQKQEAKAEQGTADSGEDEEEKAPSYMHSGDEQRELEEKWKEISERMLVDLETSSKEWGDKSDGMLQGIKKINRDKYDYATFLRKFSTLKEDIQINDDEFDYVYYTLGMERYGNIPLIEPLEYKEVRKVRDFVIAIDTSGSCAGDVVQKFLDKTFSIFMQQENFFRKINLHIIQCDAEIQEVVKITDKTEFEDYIRNLEFKGFGGTDFRPVFEYVNTMIDAGEFDDLKGLIYFTDGNGTYPKRRPPYETAFIFVDDDEFEYQVPSWAMKLVLETSDITEEVLI